MRLMKIKYPHKTELKDRLHSCLDMCRIPHVIFDDVNYFTIFIDKGKCTWQQVMTEVNRVHAVKFRYVNDMYIRSGKVGGNIMEWLWIIAGIIGVAYMLCKESSVKQVPKDSDFIKANQDYYSGKYSAKEVDKRLQNGYYVKKDK